MNLLPQTVEVKYLRHSLAEVKQFLFSRNKTADLPLKLLPVFSEFIWGLPRKSLIIIAGRTSEGKSAMAAQFAYDLAVQGKTVLFLSLETTMEKMGARIFCLHNRYNNTRAFRGGVIEQPYEWDRFEREMKEIPLIINDMLGKSWEDIDNVIRECQLKPDVVIVDYIQTIADRDGKNKLDTINEYIRRFREMAIRHDFAGILCSQINRSQADEKDHQPQLHQLKGSGFLEEHADMVLLLSWPFKYIKQVEGKMLTDEQRHKFVVYVAKNKDGQTGYKKLKFTPEFYLFEDWNENEKIKPASDAPWQD
jgi:replicative DNA helicase